MSDIAPQTPTTANDTVHGLHRVAQRFVGVAQAMTLIMGLLGVVAGIGLALVTEETEGFITTSERPYIWLGIVAAVGAVWLTVVVLAALAYVEWRLADGSVGRVADRAE